MKQLFVRLSRLIWVEALLAIAAIILGFPASWVVTSSFLVLDFAAIMLVGKDSFPGSRERSKVHTIGKLCLIGA